MARNYRSGNQSRNLDLPDDNFMYQSKLQAWATPQMLDFFKNYYT